VQRRGIGAFNLFCIFLSVIESQFPIPSYKQWETVEGNHGYTPSF